MGFPLQHRFAKPFVSLACWMTTLHGNEWNLDYFDHKIEELSKTMANEAFESCPDGALLIGRARLGARRIQEGTSEFPI